MWQNPLGLPSGNVLTESHVNRAQMLWADAIVAIGRAFTNGENYRATATDVVNTLYAYDAGTVLFKPTKAAAQQFRLTKEHAISYFVTGVIPEDTGFALQPWSAVRFENASIIVGTQHALAMGNYFFTDANTSRPVKVEYTFGYTANASGDLLINLHHSSMPYKPPRPTPVF